DGACLWTSTDIGPTSGQENCPSFTITYAITGVSNGTGTDDASGTTLNLGVSTVCYTITDGSGNSDSCCFDVQVSDCEDPEIICPPSQTFECDGAGNAGDLTSWLALVSATDNCDNNPGITNSVFNTISDCGTTATTVYEFTAIDNSNNSATCVSSFIVKDRIAPTIDTEASDLTVTCESGASNSNTLIAWLSNNGGATASDVCSVMTWSHNYMCGGTGSSTVTFTATDDCGNTSTTQATFTIEDTTSPVLNLPTNITLECGDDVNSVAIENWLNSATGEDSCDGTVEVVSSYPDVLVPGCGETSVTTVEFIVEDDCGNFTTGTRTITIEDTQDPVLLIEPDDLVLECADPNNPALLSAWLSSNGGAIAEDNCSTITWSNMALGAIDACGNTSSTPYVFTVTDACGNTTTASADVITEDNTSPSLVLPTDMTVECDGAGNTTAKQNWLASISGSDTCSDVTTDSELFNTISACGGGDTETYLFTATDVCGNTSTGLSSFTIEDTTSPVITCPDNLELECGNIDNDLLVLEWLGLATATDVCTDGADIGTCTEGFVRVTAADLGLTLNQNNQSITNADVSSLYV
ncbi:HYR domain-containing protein, partial [Saprospiraceae bacterium]|nr:HYR domain-containing protein [Saprospiraceae bacterium]